MVRNSWKSPGFTGVVVYSWYPLTPSWLLALGPTPVIAVGLGASSLLASGPISIIAVGLGADIRHRCWPWGRYPSSLLDSGSIPIITVGLGSIPVIAVGLGSIPVIAVRLGLIPVITDGLGSSDCRGCCSQAHLKAIGIPCGCVFKMQISGTTLNLLNLSLSMGPRSLNFKPTLQEILMHTKIWEPPWKGLEVEGYTHTEQPRFHMTSLSLGLHKTWENTNDNNN